MLHIIAAQSIFAKFDYLTMGGKTALIIGATGLTGGECMGQLLQSPLYAKVIALTRKQLNTPVAKLVNLPVDFENLDKYSGQIKADDIYCCIGTTIGKAGSRKAFRKVDYDIPLKVAQLARANGAEQFILVSSLGANAGSGVFYSRVKGELEEALKKLLYPALLIFRPSILLGNRKEKRTGEEIGKFVMEKFSFVLGGALKKYRGTPANVLAKAMVNAANSKMKGVHIMENDQIFALSV